jgi:uncharacterized membrane protein
MPRYTSKDLAVAGIVAGLYASLSIAVAPLSYGVYQVRLAEALTVLPFLSAAAVPGLFVGCLVANLFGGMGWPDVVFGSLITLAAAIMTRWCGSLVNRPVARWLAPAWPVLLNALGVSIYLAPLLGYNYWFSVQMIGLGEAIACYVLGLPLLIVVDRRLRHLFN